HLSNTQEKNAYIVYVKQKIKQDSECQPGLNLGQLKKQNIIPSENILCIHGLENMKKKVQDAQANGGGNDKQINKFNSIIEKKQNKLNAKFDKIRERLEKAISEPENEKPISQDEKNKVNEQDKKDTAEHQSQT